MLRLLTLISLCLALGHVAPATIGRQRQNAVQPPRPPDATIGCTHDQAETTAVARWHLCAVHRPRRGPSSAARRWWHPPKAWIGKWQLAAAEKQNNKDITLTIRSNGSVTGRATNLREDFVRPNVTTQITGGLVDKGMGFTEISGDLSDGYGTGTFKGFIGVSGLSKASLSIDATFKGDNYPGPHKFSGSLWKPE
jgi:hypothetical protein